MNNNISDKDIVNYYNSLSEDDKIIRAISLKLNVSYQRVLKTLASNDIIINDTHMSILKLKEKGFNSLEIAHKLGMSERIVKAYFPYKRPIYNINPSTNAQRIKKCRENKKQKMLDN